MTAIMPTRPLRLRALRTVLLVVVAAALAAAHAQAFSATRYLEECLGFEAGGDLTTARESCLNALEADGDLVEASLALARIELGLGELASAETRLTRVRGRIAGAEPALLLAEIAFAGDRVDEAAGRLTNARTLLVEFPNATLLPRVAFLEGRVAEARGEIDAAQAAYGEAIAADPLALGYRLTDAELRFGLGDLDGALAQLRAYERLSGDELDPDVKSLSGRILWAQGRNDEAAAQFEAALALRPLRETAAQATDLRALAVLYMGQGDLEGGGLALREALRRGNLLQQFDGNALLWLLVLAVLLAVHLVGEARQSGLVHSEEEKPRTWTVGQAYGVLVTGALVGLAATLVYGSAVHGNLLVLFSPYLQHEARAVYLIAFGLTVAGLSWWRVRANGWDAARVLLGRSDGVLAGVLVGALVFGAMVAYLLYTPATAFAGPFFLDLASLTPLRIAALAVVPLAELGYRGLLRPAAERRYGSGPTVVIVALVWSLAYATPLLVLVPVGFALAELDRRRPNGLAAATTLWIGWLALAATVAVSPFVRSLFL